jgi:hypothetical protein
MLEIILKKKGIFIKDTTTGGNKFFPCGVRIESTLTEIMLLQPSRSEQDFIFKPSQVQSLTDYNGVNYPKSTTEEIITSIADNICQSPTVPPTPQNSMRIPTPQILLNNYPNRNSIEDKAYLTLFWEGEETDFLAHNPKFILERYKKKKSSRKQNRDKGRYYVIQKKGFVHPIHKENKGRNYKLFTEWETPTTAKTPLRIEFQSVFVSAYFNDYFTPTGQGNQSTAPNRKNVKFQYFRFKTEITKNGIKYYSEPSQIFAVGGNWLNKQRNQDERYLQVFFK